jgi:cobalt/nickel transport system permease protein
VSFDHLDRYAAVDSLVTRRPPTARLVAVVIFAVAAAVLPLGAWPQLAVMAALVAGAAAAARLRPRHFLARLAPPLVFVLLVSVAILFLAPGDTVLAAGPLRITDEGRLRFGSALGRAAVALGAAVILVSTTRFADLVDALRTLRLPRVMTDSLTLAYRYLYTLNDEVERLRRAARSRNAATGAASRRRLLMGIAAAAFHRSFDRSERVYQAMLARGYQGHIPALHPPAYTGRPIIELAALALLLAALVASAWVGGA